jgi:hypothetical protein
MIKGLFMFNTERPYHPQPLHQQQAHLPCHHHHPHWWILLNIDFFKRTHYQPATAVFLEILGQQVPGATATKFKP